jgi:uncharacterized membrane protein
VPFVEYVGEGVEYAGIAAMVVGMAGALVAWLVSLVRGDDREEGYVAFRNRLGRAILLGLEFLVAGDILRTVAIEPTLTSVTVLGLIVIIRTFLSFTLQLEIEGRWPWQQRPEPPPRTT